MGCGASTAVTPDQIRSVQPQDKIGDIPQLTRVTVDSGDLSVKDTHIFGDQVTPPKGAVEDDTNFHNSPSNIANDVKSSETDVKKSSAENETNSDPRHSINSQISHNEKDTNSKKSNATNDQYEFVVKNDDNTSQKQDTISQQLSSHSKASSRHSHVYKPTTTSSDDEDSKLSTKISKELSNQYEESIKSKDRPQSVKSKENEQSITSKQDQISKKSELNRTSLYSNYSKGSKKSKEDEESLKSKDIEEFLKSNENEESLKSKEYDHKNSLKSNNTEPNIYSLKQIEEKNINSLPRKITVVNSLENSDDEKYEKVSQSSHTLTGSNRSPYFDTINANADINQYQEEEIICGNIAMGTGDINQNHRFKSFPLETSDYKDERINIHEENLDEPKNDILGTGDMYFAKITPFIEDDYNNQLHSNFIIGSDDNKNITSSRISHTSEVSKQFSNTSPFKDEFLKTAEVHDDNLEESLHGFDMKDKIVDFNNEDNEEFPLPETTNEIQTLPNNIDIQDNQYEE